MDILNDSFFNSPLTFDNWKEGKKKENECFFVLIMEYGVDRGLK
jgi:hypothetical protein